MSLQFDSTSAATAQPRAVLFDFCLLRKFERRKGSSCYKGPSEFAEIAFPREIKTLLLLLRNYPQIVAIGLQMFRSMRVVWLMEPYYWRTQIWERESDFSTITRHLSAHLTSPDLTAPSEESFNTRVVHLGRKTQLNNSLEDSCHIFLGSIGYVADTHRRRSRSLDQERIISVANWLRGATAMLHQKDASLICLQTLPRDCFTLSEMTLLVTQLLEVVAREGSLEHTRHLCERSAVISQAPVFAASQHGHCEVLRMLNSFGADVKNSCNRRRWTPLHCAALHGRADVVQLLHSLGADVNLQHEHDMDGRCPLWYAVFKGHSEVVKLLHSLGADVNAQDSTERGLVWIATMYNHAETVKLLHSLGADVNTPNRHGQTPVWEAASRGSSDLIKILGSLGADVTSADGLGQTPVHIAARLGHEEAVEMLHSFGADIHTSYIGGKPLVVDAAWAGRVGMIQLLHRLGADMNAKLYGKSPLWYAVENRQSEAVKVLCALGANVNSQVPNW